MIDLSLAEVAAATAGTTVSAPAQVTVTAGVTTDSRLVVPGSLFVAVRGERADGHDFLGGAFDDGAVGALVAADFPGTPAHEALLASHPEAHERLIAVGDVIAALGLLARHALARLRELGDIRVVGLTGSVGKTTTKDLLAGVLRGGTPAEDPSIISPPGSFNNELGLPLTVLRATPGTRVLVLEMGADHIGNIEYLTSVAPPDVAIVLAVGRAHLGEFGGIEAVARAKGEMVTGATADATVVLNADDQRVAAMASLAGGSPDGDLAAPRRVVTFSRSGGGDVVARDVRLDATGRASFDLDLGGEPAGRVSLGLVGDHHVANALAAAAAAQALGVEPADIVERLTGLAAASPHRMAVSERPDGVLVVDDSYNANPDSMRAALRSLDSLGAGRTRRIAVFGEMLELGDAAPGEHHDVGAEAARCGIDVLLAVGAGAEQYARGFEDGAPPPPADAAPGAGTAEPGVTLCRIVPDVDAAEQALRELVAPGDVVLVKGSNGSGLWRLADRFVSEEVGR